MAMAALFDPVQAAFDSAMSDFKAELKDDQVYNEMLQITTIDQVYDATDEIQRKQAKEGHLRHLSKISPYLDRLNEYAATIEVFMQVKPDILALIWGPIKLLLQWTSVLRASFDAIINTMAEIGELLPEFRRVIALFDQNVAIQEVMALFFRDILDFYLVALKFFKLSRWKYLFESLWPTHKEKIKVVMTHIQSHGRLMRNEVRLEHIQQEHQARQLALKNFEKLELERRAQEYHRIKTDMASDSYDKRLDLLRHLVCQGTGAWLLQDATFKTWLNFASQEARVLWLQGIPGAGKTYLASEVIKKTQSMKRTAFAFLSYKHQHDSTAISIIHSLIFQLVTGNNDLQTVICQSCREECKTTLEGATDLLVTILACTGPAYLIIDGLDEIGEVERRRLLTQLLRTLKLSLDAKLFISSRAEADLVSILHKDATVLQIEQRNIECIQIFVKQWTQSWFVERQFWPDEQTEIELGLEPLASKSQGMFLYAKVVLDSIRFLDNFGDIRDELHAFPETLEDAYGRILRRVNNLDSFALREKIRLVLGWVGCSPTVLTIQEIQQALAIDLEDPEKIGNVRGSLDLVRICGPIVELVDGYVQFVHFTVKEYIFSNRISGFIDLRAATLDLTLRCTTYLLQGHHDLDLSDEEIKRNILSGTYTMEWLATNMWPQLTKDYLSSARHDDPQENLGSRLEALRIIRFQDGFSEQNENDEIFLALDNSKKAYPEAYALVGQALRFRQMCTGSEHRMYLGAPWIDLDPLTTSESSVRIFKAVEDLLTHNQADGYSHEHIIRRWYGQRPYKCHYLSCDFNRTGFVDISQVRSHEKNHERPWKCSFPDCEYANGGFLTGKMRDDHLERAHSKGTKHTLHLTKLGDHAATESLLVDLAKLGLADDVEYLLSFMPLSPSQMSTQWTEEMWDAAILSGSLPMVKLCDSKLRFPLAFEDTVTTVIQNKNVEILEYFLLIHRGKWQFYQRGIKEALLLGDCNLIYPWVNYIKLKSSKRSSIDFPLHVLNNRSIVQITANDASREDLLIQLWRSIEWENGNSKTAKEFWGSTLLVVAGTTCSVTLARHLINCGAKVDYRRNLYQPTPLRHAARKDTAEAAAFMKLMLFHGADPNIEQLALKSDQKIYKSPIKISDEKGPLGISKWLGITWDELVREMHEKK
ncbi:NACHT domain protein [Xylaria sp. FL1777]|nr:NACHT domain protein [Xylaria sp. FL1777]